MANKTATLRAADGTPLSVPYIDNGDGQNGPLARDGGPGWTSALGVAGVRVTSADQSAADLAVTDVPTAGKTLVVTDLLISVGTAMTVDVKDGSAGPVLMTFYMAANTSVHPRFRGKVKLGAINRALFVRTSTAGNVAVTAVYTSE